MAETLAGSVERITFHNPDTGFAVLKVLVRGRRGVVTVVGTVPRIEVGERIEATGEWVIDRTHGEQFKAESLHAQPPATVEGIEKYLGSGLVKGIGPHYARKIVEVFGDRALEVIDESPTFLKEVKGIGPKRLQRIRESWQQQRAVRNIMVFLQSHGVGIAKAVRIYKTYGDQAVETVQANPYRLSSDVWGFGFQSADHVARRLGLDPSSRQRAQAAVRHVLQEASQQEGHVGYPEAGLIANTVQMLTDIDKATLITSETVAAAVEVGRAEEELVREPGLEEPWLYLKPLFLAEHGLARVLIKLGEGPHPLLAAGSPPPRPSPTRGEGVLVPLPPGGGGPGWGGPSADAVLVGIEKKIGLSLAPKQRDAVRMATQHKLLVITGGPGTGKTTLVRSILEVFAARGLRCALCAPTGRAAKRLSETTGREAKTIHRLLEFDPALGYFKRDLNQPLDADLVVVDETSMVDVSLMYSLAKAVPYRACLVLVGDVDQLPSVGPGAVLADLIGSGVVPVVRLTEIFRQAGASWIVRAAHAINAGELPESAPAGQGDFYFVEASTPEAILERIIIMVKERIPARFGLDPFRDVQVLTPMHLNLLGTRSLNLELQKVLNPPHGGSEVERNSWTFRAGDKVLQTVNDYDKEVFNGDVGRVKAVDPAERELTVAFDNREVVYDFDELDELQLAYALSCHKSQGSEYPAVVVPLHTQHYMMLQRNLLYTAVTRGKQLVVVVGSRKALEMAVQRQSTARRYSALAWRLRQQAEVGEETS